MDRPTVTRYGLVSAARPRALRCASHTSKIIGKPCAGKPHARFERGFDGNRSAVRPILRHNLPMQPDPADIARWSGAAPFWEKYRETIRQMFVPVTQALVEDGQIGSGHAVLDIATGPGEPALSVADLVGPE